MSSQALPPGEDSLGVAPVLEERPATEHVVPYGGIATRGVALAVDALIANVVVFIAGAILALVMSLVTHGGDRPLGPLGTLLAGVGWLIFLAAYFVVFWSSVGQTPGMRLMGLRVVAADGNHPGVPRSIVRVVGLGLAIIPLMAGFLPVLVDNRRRALQDFLARTTVRYDHRPSAVIVPLSDKVLVAAEAAVREEDDLVEIEPAPAQESD